mmetsp:Transcript_22146/g.61541  ORF Transcript_22146/g.61541 Transcript_22146/m.61541 type:complete len:151 (+) Transcript_22146:1194-1646(+)
MGRFSDGILDCCSRSEDGYCLTSALCPAATYSVLMEKLQLNWCANPTDERGASATFPIVTTVYVVSYFLGLFSLLGPIYLALTIYLLVIYTKTRTAVREKYKIPGDCCSDCFLSWFCNCCTSLQLYRHMHRSGDRPHRFQSWVAEGAIVV